ncbi:4-alpha-glucanotransferase [Acidipropionibacterium virtanenii]|uniref:4-alpha-glucanotransferase n=1 Tax=Acidipropionibacterium virtanenii TaxID=2057246 RepID=A0A344USN7_9ACTN|nr:4-alpha-glucanotransferase [Acidipropionibacterium virtanenii]AXE38285.1 4-alpha-glucanotransferase [Acidipropionibacterium virtanenii]
MPLTDPALVALAEHFGVAQSFTDWKGRQTFVDEETVRAVLGGLGIDAGTSQKARAALVEVEERPWRRTLPPCTVLRQGQEGRIDIHLPAGQGVDVSLELEDGRTRACSQVDNWNPDRQIDGRAVGEATFSVPGDLPLGYHTVVAATADRRSTASLIVTPGWVGLPASMGSRRVWGYAAQVYSVRSHNSWGMGDLTDLADLCTWSATQGADYLLINPLHAAEVVTPMEPSPYLPSSRLFINPIYVRPELIPEFQDLDDAARDRARRLRIEAVGDDAAAERIDRDRSWTCRRPVLEAIHRTGLGPARRMAFRAFKRLHGTRLSDFAAWCAISEVHGSDWRLWPEPLQHPGSREVAAFVASHASRSDFYEWLQWIAEQQLSAADRAGRDSGMALGLICDLAVGVSGCGADTWMLPNLFAEGVSVGSPPDQFNQAGQDWGQPPMRPDVLADMAYRPFREMVAGALRHAGGLRMDHIMGLFRLWWVPQGLGPRKGAYVRYDHEAMVGILALEAYRAGALVIGEDLGTVEPWVRDYLRERGVFGTSVMWFELDGSGHPLAPEYWREYALSSVTTHDLPPTIGYLAGDHIELRHRLGLLTESLDSERARAVAEREQWVQELRRRGALSSACPSDEEVVVAMHRLLTLTPSRILNATLTDAVGDRRTQNLPGTVNEYPNWRVPLSGPDGRPMWLEDLYVDQRAARIAEVLDGG